jgi:hypothetical protein
MKQHPWFIVFAIVMVMIMSVAHADNRPNIITSTWQIKPQAIPTVLTDVCRMIVIGTPPPCGQDIYACLGDVNMDPAATAVNVTVQDNQASPIPYWNQVPISGATSAGGAGYKIFDASEDTGCRWFPKGMSVKASTTGSYIYMSGKW